MNGIRCPSCSTPLVDRPNAMPAVCSGCGTAYLFDEFGSYVPFVAEGGIGEADATARIMEWASGVKGGREFSKNIELGKMARRHFPVFVFEKTRSGHGQETIASAVATAEPGIRNIDFSNVQLAKLASGQMEQPDFVKPNMGPAAYQKLLSVDPSSRSLVFYPFWCTQYVYRGKLNTVTVDGCTGRVSGDLSVEIERRSSMPLAAGAFIAIGLEGALAYFSWFVAAAAAAVTAAAIFQLARRRREE